MAGRLKHMERSHRSYRSNGAEFVQFHRHAYNVAQRKETKKTFGQHMSALFRRMIPQQKEA